MANKRRLIGPVVFVPILIGGIGFFNLTRNPKFQAFHTVDVVQLLGSGACFGVALVALFAILRRSSTE
jgi:hypothetical protein